MSALEQEQMHKVIENTGVAGVGNESQVGEFDNLNDRGMVLVDKGFLLALIETADRETCLDSVYDDKRGTSYCWSNMIDFISGVDDSELREILNREKL